ncbi:MAG: MFS transporter [Gammaproteobacteria bacterium]
MGLIVFCLSLCGFMVLAVMRVTDPILPIVADEFGRTIGAAGIIVTAFSIPYGLFQLMFGPLGDRHGKLRVIIYTLALSSVCTITAAFADSIEFLAAARFLSGLTTASAIPLSMAFIADNVDYTHRQPAIARYFSGLILGQITGSSLGGIFADLYGWRMIFVIFGATTAIATAILWLSCRAHTEKRVETRFGRDFFKPYIDLLKLKRPRQLITTALIEGTVFFAGLAYIGAYLHASFELSYAKIGLAVACAGFGGLIYIAVVKHIVRILGERGMIQIGGLIMAAGFVVLVFIPGPMWAFPLLLVTGFGMYVMHNTLQTLATEIAPNARGTAISLFAFVLMSGQGAGVAVYGYIIDEYGFRPAYLMAASVIALLATWFQSTLKRD